MPGGKSEYSVNLNFIFHFFLKYSGNVRPEFNFNYRRTSKIRSTYTVHIMYVPIRTCTKMDYILA